MQNYTFTVTIENANLILNALSNLPYRQVKDLIDDLQSQAQKQLSQLVSETVPENVVSE